MYKVLWKKSADEKKNRLFPRKCKLILMYKIKKKYLFLRKKLARQVIKNMYLVLKLSIIFCS